MMIFFSPVLPETFTVPSPVKSVLYICIFRQFSVLSNKCVRRQSGYENVVACNKCCFHQTALLWSCLHFSCAPAVFSAITHSITATICYNYCSNFFDSLLTFTSVQTLYILSLWDLTFLFSATPQKDNNFITMRHSQSLRLVRWSYVYVPAVLVLHQVMSKSWNEYFAAMINQCINFVVK